MLEIQAKPGGIRFHVFAEIGAVDTLQRLHDHPTLQQRHPGLDVSARDKVLGHEEDDVAVIRRGNEILQEALIVELGLASMALGLLSRGQGKT